MEQTMHFLFQRRWTFSALPLSEEMDFLSTSSFRGDGLSQHFLFQRRLTFSALPLSRRWTFYTLPLSRKMNILSTHSFFGVFWSEQLTTKQRRRTPLTYELARTRCDKSRDKRGYKEDWRPLESSSSWTQFFLQKTEQLQSPEITAGK